MRVTLTILIFFSTLGSHAQSKLELKDLFTEDTIIWYGIDYTHTQFIGTFTNKELRDYFHGWNRLILEESEKYDVGKSLQKKSVIISIDHVERINKESTPHIATMSSDSMLQKSDLETMISAYKNDHKHGLGFVLIAEHYNRPKDFATHYAVIFDIATKKILISQKYSASPDGIGVRNFWAHTIFKSLKLVEHNYKKWKTKYSGVPNG